MNNGMYANKPTNIKKPATSDKLSLLQRGSVTEITLGDKTFQVTDPQRVEHTITVLKQHDESLHILRQRQKELTSSINILISEVNALKQEVQRLKEITNGFGSQEYTNYKV